MAAGGISSVKSQKKSQSISSALASAVLEWLLICMLFIDAIFSYLITKFACHCELQAPCLLCSRLDHILGNKKLKYYWDLICGHHKLEISSLVFCHAHNNLVDVNGICESCLFSFATINKSSAETYRLLVGKLGENSSFGSDQDPLLEDHSSSTRQCSCCNKPWIPRGFGQKLMHDKFVGSRATHVDGTLSGPAGLDRENLRKSKRSVSVRATRQRTNVLDGLSHVGYTELKINSDTDDDDEVNTVIHETNSQEDVVVGYMQPCIMALPNDMTSEKLIEPVSAPEPSVFSSPVHADVIESHGVTAIASRVDSGHGLEELDWQKAGSSELPELISIDEVSPPSISQGTLVEASKETELISLDDVPPSADARELPVEASKESELISVDDFARLPDAKESSIEESKESKLISVDDVLPSVNTRVTSAEISNDSKLISLADVLPSSNGAETPVQGLEERSSTEEVWKTSVIDCDDNCKAGSQPATKAETVSESDPVSGNSGPQLPNLLELSDAYKLAINNRGRQLSGVLAEQWTGKDSSRVSEDLKLLLTQLSAVREQSMNDVSPRVPISPRIPMSPKLSINSDELRTSDASSTIGIQLLQKRISLERNESGLSLDGSIISEIEGESAVDRLKRQIEHDKKLLGALYKELEEERNASTIAANQAMAMITRLQEEKAALHMEALQCLRMMEEQSEYDMEALQKTNDLLTEKEKEIQDLETELEFYRNKYPNESMLEYTVDTVSDTKATDMKVNHSESSCREDTTSKHRSFVNEEPDTCNNVEGPAMSTLDTNIVTVNNSLEFEEERLHILQGLRELKRKLFLFSNNGISLDTSNDEHSQNGDGGNELNERNSKLVFEQNSAEENDTSLQNSIRSEPVQEHISSLQKSDSIDKADDKILHSGQTSHVPSRGIDLNSLATELSDLNQKLGALEADQNFLEHTINSIRCGEEGLRFVQEIASHLKELRRIGIGRKEQITIA